MRSKRGNESFLRSRDRERQAKHQQHDHDSGNDEGQEGSFKATHREGMPDQTGQNRARSAKARQQIAEAKDGKSQNRVLSTIARLGA